MKKDDGRRFNITASGSLHTLPELEQMADEILAVADEVGAQPKTISELDHAKIWARWNAPKTGKR
jgi:hypothetical protein